MNITLRRKEKIITVEGEDGVGVDYKLRELTGAQRDSYLNFTAKAMALGADGRPTSVRDFAGLQTRLVALSLYNSDGKSVVENVIQGWPTSAVESLFQEAQTLSGLDKVPEAKNDQRGSVETGSV